MRDLRVFLIFLLLGTASVLDHLTTDWAMSQPVKGVGALHYWEEVNSDGSSSGGYHYDEYVGLLEKNTQRVSSESWVAFDVALLLILYVGVQAIIRLFPSMSWRYWVMVIPLLVGSMRSVVVVSNFMEIARYLNVN